jgi:hypothetical protein
MMRTNRVLCQRIGLENYVWLPIGLQDDFLSMETPEYEKYTWLLG